MEGAEYVWVGHQAVLTDLLCVLCGEFAAFLLKLIDGFDGIAQPLTFPPPAPSRPWPPSLVDLSSPAEIARTSARIAGTAITTQNQGRVWRIPSTKWT